LKENRRDPLSLLSKKLTTKIFETIKPMEQLKKQVFQITPEEIHVEEINKKKIPNEKISNEGIPELNDFGILYVSVVLKYYNTLSNNGFPFRINGQFKKETDDNNYIRSHYIIAIEISKNVDVTKYYSYIYNRILEDLRHEIEHTNQTINHRRTPNNLKKEELIIPASIINSQEYKDNIGFFKDIVFAYGYLGNLLETEAFIEGFMARSKNEKIPIETHLNTNFFYSEYSQFISDNVNKKTEIGIFLINAYNSIKNKMLYVANELYKSKE